MAEIFREHHDFVWRCVHRMGVPTAAVDDVVQDVFLVVSRRLSEFEGRSALRTWIYAIARNVVHHHFRATSRRERKHAALQQSAVEQSLDTASSQDAARTLRQMLLQLDEAKREVFILAELEGMTCAEIAGLLDTPAPTIYSRLRAAREQLQRQVEQIQRSLHSPVASSVGTRSRGGVL